MAFFGLSGFLGRALGAAYPFVRAAVTLGSSIASIGEALLRAGSRVEASALRRLAEREAVIRGAEREVLSLPVTTVIPDERIPEAITRQRRTYAWQTRFGFIDPRTGKRNQRFLTVSTDRQLSAEEALEEARQMLEEEYDIDPSFLIDEQVIGVTRAGPGRRL